MTLAPMFSFLTTATGRSRSSSAAKGPAALHGFDARVAFHQLAGDLGAEAGAGPRAIGHVDGVDAGGVFVSSDQGVNWQMCNGGMVNSDVYSIWSHKTYLFVQIKFLNQDIPVNPYNHIDRC